jgi:hypothetical protein
MMTKKMRLAVLVAVFCMSVAAVSFAQDSDKDKGPIMGREMMGKQGMMEHKGWKDQGGRKGCMGEMPGMMGMSRTSMVATSDGGVVVLSGTNLYKYDKNLNLVKKTQIKIDTEGMQKMMLPMKEKCCEEEAQMKGDTVASGGAQEAPAKPGTPQCTSGHEVRQ